MKCTNLLIIIFFLCSLSTYAQEDNAKGKIIFKNVALTEKTTITVNIEGYDMNNVGALKDELLGYKEKIATVKINDKHTQMLITYSGNMLREDLIRAFENHRISYRVQTSTAPLETVKE